MLITNCGSFVEKGTSQLLLDADWDAIIALCDYVRSGEVKYVLYFSSLI